MAKIIVIDGCTVDIDSQTVRLAVVHAPEYGKPFAGDATEYLEKLVVDKDIELEVVSVVYDEAVVKIWVDGKSINEAMNKFLKKLGSVCICWKGGLHMGVYEK